MNLPDQLRAFRIAHRLTQEQAAIKLGVAVSTLRNWEQGTRKPKGLAASALQEKLTKPLK